MEVHHELTADVWFASSVDRSESWQEMHLADGDAGTVGRVLRQDQTADEKYSDWLDYVES